MTAPLAIQIVGRLPPATCGIADYTAFLVWNLAELGAPVEIWTRAEYADHPLARACVSRWDRAGLRNLARRLRDVRPRVVHLQYQLGIYEENPRIALLPLMLRGTGTSLVTTFHSLDGPAHWGKAHRAALLPLLIGSRDLVVCSPRQQRALQRVPRLRARTHLIPIGNAIEVTADALPPLHESGTGLRLVYFGFVWRGRHVETVLRALAAVSASDPQATLDVVGGIRDQEYWQQLRALATELGVDTRVRFSSDVAAHEISHALRRADIALLPYSTGVSTGRGTLMAALGHGLPVVTFGMDDNLSPLFRHGENMMIAQAGDEAEFIAQVCALAADPHLRSQVTAGAVRLAAEFRWTRIARQVLDLPSYAGLVPRGAD